MDRKGSLCRDSSVLSIRKNNVNRTLVLSHGSDREREARSGAPGSGSDRVLRSHRNESNEQDPCVI